VTGFGELGEAMGDGTRVETTADRLLIEVDLSVPVERVWAAFTSPAAIAARWGEHVRLVPRRGGELRETGTDAAGRPVVTRGTVTRFDPPRALAMSRADDDRPEDTNVLVALEGRAHGGTRLRREPGGWQVLPEVRRDTLIEQHARGWRHHLDGPRAHLHG
jgi:uncharacterized protein YndB with AHSA1/START domain